ncbi:hypothetical protein J3F84DRAFT_90726 [Trichoderma pleuroticola]
MAGFSWILLVPKGVGGALLFRWLTPGPCTPNSLSRLQQFSGARQLRTETKRRRIAPLIRPSPPPCNPPSSSVFPFGL